MLEQFKSLSKKNKIVLTIILVGTIVIFSTITLAFFSIDINGDSQPLSVQSGTLILNFNDVNDNVIIDKKVNIDNVIEKDMVVTNNGTNDATATIMWNDLENTYLEESLTYTIKQTREYNKDENVELNTLNYNIDTPQYRVNVPTSETPSKKVLSKEINIPAGKKIYYRVTITYNHLDDVNQNSDLEARLYTSFTIENGEQLEPFILTYYNYSTLGITGEEENLVIPSVVQDRSGMRYRLSEIKEYAFAYLEFKTVTIPSSITNIGDHTFYSCSKLTSVTLPNTITNIGNNAFAACKNLTSIEIPNSVTSIGNNAFYGCNNLTSIVIPAAITNMGSSAFSNCSNLSAITISDGASTIGTDAFSNCNSLTSITIPASITNIGESAFSGCTALTAINVDANNQKYKSIDGVLYTKNETTIIQFPSDKTDNSYTISNGVNNIGAGAFSSCNNLTTIIIPDSVINIGSSAFSSCSNLTTINIPHYVTSIENNTFYGCSSLVSITIPESVTNIGKQAFSFCWNLTSITIPNSVTTIKDSAFSYCSSLASVIYKDITYTHINEFKNAFTSTSGNTMGSNAFEYTKLTA